MDLQNKEYYISQYKKVILKKNKLSKTGYIFKALTIILPNVIAQIESTSSRDLEWDYWYPLYLFVEHHSIDHILKFEDDLQMIVEHSDENYVKSINNFLTSSQDKNREWSSKLFEIYIKRILLENFKEVSFDFQLPNGKRPDAKIILNTSNIFIEITALTESDEDRVVWDNFMEDLKSNPEQVLVRPGKFYAKGSKSPSPYYDAVRFYSKVYDKIAHRLNINDSQLSDDYPNILIIFLYTPTTSLNLSLGINWALEELLSIQPTGQKCVDSQKTIDISLSSWLEFYAQELISNDLLTQDSFIKNHQKISGIIIFDRFKKIQSRINYNASEKQKISHYLMSEIEKIFDNHLEWYT
ncbi:MAG: hypothetical protein ACFFDN_34045 [Candidatus Hodarchaeota archaeon]